MLSNTFNHHPLVRCCSVTKENGPASWIKTIKQELYKTLTLLLVMIILFFRILQIYPFTMLRKVLFLTFWWNILLVVQGVSTMHQDGTKVYHSLCDMLWKGFLLLLKRQCLSEKQANQDKKARGTITPIVIFILGTVFRTLIYFRKHVQLQVIR